MSNRVEIEKVENVERSGLKKVGKWRKMSNGREGKRMVEYGRERWRMVVYSML